LAIASIGDFGTRWAAKSFRVNAVVFRPVVASTGGSGRFRCAPSCITFDSTMPRLSEISDAITNQAMAFMPMRPAARPSPMCAMPTASVEKTSSEMIILINRRNTSVTMEMWAAMSALIVLSATVSCRP